MAPVLPLSELATTGHAIHRPLAASQALDRGAPHAGPPAAQAVGFPEITAGAARLPGATALDGEPVVWSSDRLAFERLQHRAQRRGGRRTRGTGVAGSLRGFRLAAAERHRHHRLALPPGVRKAVVATAVVRARVVVRPAVSGPLNVHVNRAPLTGMVTSVEHVPGGFVPAFNKESENNEGVVRHFDTELGDMEMVRIAA